MALRGAFWAYSEDGREFSITRRDLKTPWLNYLSTDGLKSVLTHTGSGLSFNRSPYNDSFLHDRNPRLVFVRDQDSGASWTINGTDTPKQPQGWMCTHGFGYTRIESKTQDIAGRVTYFLPSDESAEVWRIRLENTSARGRHLRVFALTLWDLGARHYDGATFSHVYFEEPMLVAVCHHWPFLNFRTTHAEYNRPWDHIGFMASSPAPSGFDAVYREFVGEDAPLTRPAAVQSGSCRQSSRRGLEPCGALQMDVTVPPGGAADLVVVVGMAKDKTDAERLRTKLATPAGADAAFTALKDWWTDYLGRMRIEVPDPDITTFANGWNRCAMHTRYYHRVGVRDTAQDLAALIPFDLERARKRMQGIFEAQYQAGCANHDVNQLASPYHISINADVPLWIPWITGKYIRETGDFGLLDQKFSYFDGGEGTAYEHCVKAVDYIRRESGRFGLPLLKCGDWNDCLMGSSKAGVSVWLGIFYHITLMEMFELAGRTGRKADAERFLAQARELDATINGVGWDGRWYLQGFDDDGGVIGGHTETEGRIYLNSQTWAVMGGLASPERARTCLEAVQELMDTPVGIPLLAPPYSKPQDRIGVISRMSMGDHHNGGVWNHAVTWAMLAECKIGRADRALDLYRKLLPPYLSQKWPAHIGEPYAFGSVTNTPVAGDTGGKGGGWNTGTVCWIYRVLFEGFAGITPEFEGLRIEPSLPSEWRKLRVTRPYRGCVYHITIEAPAVASNRVKTIRVNGNPVAGTLIPPQPSGKEVEVQVELGSAMSASTSHGTSSEEPIGHER